VRLGAETLAGNLVSLVSVSKVIQLVELIEASVSTPIHISPLEISVVGDT